MTHLVNTRAPRFTECSKDLEGTRIPTTTVPGEVTCGCCMELLAIDGRITEVEHLDFKIARLQAKRAVLV